MFRLEITYYKTYERYDGDVLCEDFKCLQKFVQTFYLPTKKGAMAKGTIKLRALHFEQAIATIYDCEVNPDKPCAIRSVSMTAWSHLNPSHKPISM